MTQYLNRLNIARILFIVSVLVGMNSLLATFQHIGNEMFTLSGFPAEAGIMKQHSWYHFLREGVADVATLIVIAILLFAPKDFRTPQTWVIGFILLLGYYAPFWIGMPFNSTLAAPNMSAELTHIGMAVFAFLAFFVARPYFYQKT